MEGVGHSVGAAAGDGCRGVGGADDQRRDNGVYLIDETSVEERPEDDAAAFDQQREDVPLAQLREERGEVDTVAQGGKVTTSAPRAVSAERHGSGAPERVATSVFAGPVKTRAICGVRPRESTTIRSG